MAFPNISDLTTTTIENRSKTIADNVTKNNALLYLLEEKGRTRFVDGGVYILEELSFAENSNAMFYSGYDVLATAAQDVLSAAQFSLKQAACAVTYSGLEILQNSGKEKMIDLVQARVDVAEASMMNLIAQGLYSDGTGYGGKQITGLLAAVPVTPTSGTYGSIDRSTTLGTFWRNQTTGTGTTITTANIMQQMNVLWAKCVRGSDHPDLIVFDNNLWAIFMAAQQSLQRYGDGKLAQAGFTTLKYASADVVLDGGVGGFAPTSAGYFLNTKYLHWRPHKDRNMSPVLGGKSRASINQDAEIQLIGWAGNLTCSNASLQGYFSGT
jgi:hypothetical protein